MAMDGTSYPASDGFRSAGSPLICLASTRWAQAGRLRALMSRFAREPEVFFLEEPVRSEDASLRFRRCAQTGVQVVTPMLPSFGPEDRRLALDLLLARSGTASAWYTDPEALAFSAHVPWLAAVYDATGERPAGRSSREDQLLQAADLVFVDEDRLPSGGRSDHPHLHGLPRGIDLDHFATARGLLPEPDDQIGLRRPLLGRFGAVDERLDLDLLTRIAAERPHWHFVMIGPIEVRELPGAANIHWLGARSEEEWPAYLSHWDLAIMPLRPGATAEAEEVPRYLAGGRRVVRTPVQGRSDRLAAMEAVATAATAEAFVAEAERAMNRSDVSDFVAVDDILETLSWDAVQAHMAALLRAAERRTAPIRMSRRAALPFRAAGEPAAAG